MKGQEILLNLRKFRDIFTHFFCLSIIMNGVDIASDVIVIS